MNIVKYRKIWFALSALLIALSLYGMFAYGFNLSIDFKGGTITEVTYQGRFSAARPAQHAVEAQINELGIGNFSVRPSESDRYIIRTRELNEQERMALVDTIGNPEVLRQNTIGPVAGTELKEKAVTAVAVVVMMIVLFITFAFRKVSDAGLPRGARGVASWKYGIATIVALVHDVVVPTGIFVLLGYLYGLEIDLLFVSGLLAILGYSVHDTIVVFDRVRENLRINAEESNKEEFEETVGKAVSQTMARSINTSVTLLITLAFLYFMGSTATKDFSLLLLIGVVVGTYSSIFLASPLLVTLYKLQKK